MGDFWRAIPTAASSIYAIVAYTISAVIFLFAYARLHLAKISLAKIEAVPETDRRRTLDIASGTALPTSSPEQWIRLNELRWLFLLLGAVLIALMTVTVMALVIQRQRSEKRLVFVRAAIEHTQQNLPVIDLTLRNDSSRVVVVTYAHVKVLDRWHIGPTWILSEVLPVSYKYDIGIPGTKGAMVTVPLLHELRPETTDHFQLTLGPSENELEGSDWYPVFGIFVNLLRIELQYNEDGKVVELPLVFTHIPPPETPGNSVNQGPSEDQLRLFLADAKAAKQKIPVGGVVDPVTVKVLDSYLRGVAKDLEEFSKSKSR